jgi:hypothetical protein
MSMPDVSTWTPSAGVSGGEQQLLSRQLLILTHVGKGLLVVVGGPAQLAFFQADLTQTEGRPECRSMIAEIFFSPVSFEKVLPGPVYLACQQRRNSPQQKHIRIHKTVLWKPRLNLPV